MSLFQLVNLIYTPFHVRNISPSFVFLSLQTAYVLQTPFFNVEFSFLTSVNYCKSVM